MNETILNKLFLKRFCLPINTDIDSYELGENSNNLRKTNICGNYNHISCILKGKRQRILSFGINTMGNSITNTTGIHAETDAISKLLPLRKKKLENIDILVIRISPTNKIQSSKPCYHCIEMMKRYPMKRGYQIQHIYYSNTYGEIIKTTLRELDNEEKHISQHYRNKAKQIHSKIVL
jgi:cytidine deaminase